MKSTPVTSTPRRATALLRALKKRANRLQRMSDLHDSGWSTTRLARRFGLSARETRDQLREYAVFAEENSLCWRIFWQEVPGTLCRGDKGRYQDYRRKLRAYEGSGYVYQGPAAAVTLADIGLRDLARQYFWRRKKEWDQL